MKKSIGRCFFKRDTGALASMSPSFLCQWLFSKTNNLILRSNHPNSYNYYHDFYTFQKTETGALWKVYLVTFIYIYIYIYMHIYMWIYIYIYIYMIILYDNIFVYIDIHKHIDKKIDR